MGKGMEVVQHVYKNAVNVLVAEIYKITPFGGGGLQPYERPAVRPVRVSAVCPLACHAVGVDGIKRKRKNGLRITCRLACSETDFEFVIHVQRVFGVMPPRAPISM